MSALWVQGGYRVGEGWIQDRYQVEYMMDTRWVKDGCRVDTGCVQGECRVDTPYSYLSLIQTIFDTYPLMLTHIPSQSTPPFITLQYNYCAVFFSHSITPCCEK